ncbi:zinc finger protein 26 [Manduca sexta]|uniref:zinc finger protein 26 n=1 Tax=Manduca sexta TaxID=7130 RepID=UPI00188EFB50|nr:zinc finger protein 26 [Manduca sexta]
MMATQQPLVLCMDNSLGEEVALRVEPEDDFQSFLDKAKGLLGLEVDINLITGNQDVSLTDNMYQFLLKAEQNMHSTQFDQMLEPNPDSVYVLDDGTQIRASQIQFDNDDPVDFAIANIPFVKYTNDVDSDIEDVVVEKTVDYNIIDSPVAKRPDHTANPQSFANSLPFKLVCTNTAAFDSQFAKYVETKTYATLNNVSNRNKSPRSLIRDNYNKYDDSYQRKTDNCSCTRDEILNMFKDSPVNSLPYEGYSERRHVRKSDPSRIHKSFKPLVADLDGVLISENGNQICFICDRKVDREKIYLFDNEDQKIHRKSPQKKTETQLKIICEKCLNENFTPCSMKSANQYLNPDEYLVIRNNQQYIFKKIKNIDFKTIHRVKRNESKKIASEEFVKVEIGSDGEIITKPIDEKSDDVIVIRDRDSSSDVEIIEPEAEIDTIIDNLDDADEQVKEFLGKYQCDGSNEVELKCRFCERTFSNISEVIEHGEVHKQDVDDDQVFPCPLCNYGYAHYKWLKGHLMAAHEKKSDDVKKEAADKDKGTEDQNQTTVEVKCEAIEENPASSDDEIWIVQTADADVEGTDQLQKLLDAANVVEKQDEVKKTPKCLNCSQIFPSLEALATHRCRRRGRKRKSTGNDSTTICMPTQQDFIKRAQGRPRQTDVNGDNSIIPKPRKKKSREPSSDPQIVTCDNCNESFTSKVRLKFHMQFHESTPMLSEGRYRCVECAGAVFGTETALFDHVHFQHDKLKRWQCPVHGCGKTFHLRATLTKHSRTHTDTRRYVCVTCGKRFLDKQTLDEHGVTHLQIKPFQCHICLKQLTRRSRLRMHVRAHEEELAPRRVLVCAACRRAFRDAPHAQEHATKSTECIEAFANDLKVESEEATVQLSPTSGIVRHTVQILESPKLSKPIPRQVDSPLAQPLLSQVTDEARSIIRVVEIEKAFRCEYCEDVFYLEDSLNSHRAIHKGVRNPFTCHICKVSFATYSRVTTHKTTHGFYKRSLASARQQAGQVGDQSSQGPAATGILGYGDFPVVKHFLCEDCGRSYLHWTYLQVHRRMKHANENYTYACNQCELTFPNSSSVGYHRKKVHGKTGPDDPPAAASKEPRVNYRIPCRDCNEVLPSKTALYKHRKKEHCDISCRPGIFCCGTCGKQYSSRAGLEAHLLSHSGNSYDKYGAGHCRVGGAGGGCAWRCPQCGARCATR